MLPAQLVPESVKSSDKWGIANINAIIRSASTTGNRWVEQKCYDIYEGRLTQADYEYLTGIDDHRMPAKVRFIPVLKTFFELLRSTVESRPLLTQVYAVDTDSMDQKRKDLANKVVNKYIQKASAYQERIYALRQQLSQMQEQDPAMVSSLRSIEREVSYAESIIDDEMQDLDRERRYGLATHTEMQVSKGLQYLNRQYHWKKKFDEGFVDLMIADNEVYKIEDVLSGGDPSFRKVNLKNFWYGASSEAYYTDEAPWCLEKRNLSISSVLDTYGHLMNADQMTKFKNRYLPEGLENNITANGYSSFSYAGPAMVDPLGLENCGANVYSGSSMLDLDSVPVYLATWKSSRRISYTETANKNHTDLNGDPLVHIHLITDEKEVAKGKNIKHRYLTDWWQGILIGEDIHVGIQKCPFQHRDIAISGKSYGPYVGYAYGADRRPNSKVWATKDIQELYNLVWYQLELLIIISGIKGFFMDKTMIPNEMSMEEWWSNVRRGVAYVDPSQNQGPGGRTVNYQQIGQFDLSFGPAIAQIVGILDRLEATGSQVLGVPRQRIGEISPTDQVGSTKDAIAQSSLTTQTLFNKHDHIQERVLDRMVNMLPFAWKNGKRGQYVTGGFSQEIFEITAKEIQNCRFKMFAGNNDKEEQAFKMAGQAMIVNYQQNGQGSLRQLIDVFKMTSLKELEDSIDYYEKLSDKRRQGEMQQQSDMEKQNAELNSQMNIMLKKQLTDGEALKGQIEQMRIQAEQERASEKNNALLQTTNIQEDTRKKVADQNAGVEMAYLEEQVRETNLDARLRQLELAMGNGKSESGISSSQPKNKTSDR